MPSRPSTGAPHPRAIGNLNRQSAVARLGQRALEGHSLEALLEEAVQALRLVMEVDDATVVRADHERSIYRICATAGLADDARGRVVGLDDPELSAAVAVSSPLVVGRQRAGVDAAVASLLGGHAHAGLLVGVRAGEGPWGAVIVRCRAQRVFSSDEADFLHTIANVLSAAIQRMGTVERMRHLALHDPLTGLPNRVLFVDHVTLALAQLSRHPSRLAVLFLDLDNFKLINDSLGHSRGDDVLRHAARVIDEILRPGDTVARLGGDEFVVLATALDDADDASLIAQRIADALRAPLVVGEREHRITASIGIALADGPGRTAEDLLSDADAAMYEAKDHGRNRFESFDDTMRDRVTRRLQIASELSRALELGEMRVDYQPIVALGDGRMRGAEALLRWRHPTCGDVGPAEFIPVAEETETILEIGEFVLREACTAAAGWHAAHPELPWTPVSVNVSLRQVRQPGLPGLVAAVLDQTGLPPGALHLEITESALMEEAETSMLTLDALKRLGVGLVLDDFGTGYSSLAYVRRFPLDAIKIDRGFVADLDRDGDSATIIEAIVNMARGLRLDVIAEGVETPMQARRLLDLRCELAQGWLYAPAVGRAEIGPMVGRRLTASSA